jgi:hypothetical protein
MRLKICLVFLFCNGNFCHVKRWQHWSIAQRGFRDS